MEGNHLNALMEDLGFAHFCVAGLDLYNEH